MHSFGERANFIWSIADLLRDYFRRGHYQDVILPFTVLRRLDCVLEPTKPHVLGVVSEDVPGTRLCDDGAESCLLV